MEANHACMRSKVQMKATLHEMQGPEKANHVGEGMENGTWFVWFPA